MIDYLIFIAALLFIFTVKTTSHSLFGRILSLLAVIIGTTMVVVLGLRLVPGDPVHYLLGSQAQESAKSGLAQELGFSDKGGKELSFVAQYSKFLKDLFSNNLKSSVSHKNTLSAVLERLPYTVALAFGAMLIALIFGTLFGLTRAVFLNRWPAYLISALTLIGISLPSFLLAPLLLMLFSLNLGLLPFSGTEDGILSLILPAFSLGIALAMMLARIITASLSEVLSEDYIRTAAAKGILKRYIIFKHALRNASITIVTIFGLQFGAILSGTVITEKIFNWPGMGLLLLDSIYQLDMPQIQTCVLVIAIMYAIINMILDCLYDRIDPRIKMRDSI